jgi:hypothetical protein
VICAVPVEFSRARAREPGPYSSYHTYLDSTREIECRRQSAYCMNCIAEPAVGSSPTARPWAALPQWNTKSGPTSSSRRSNKQSHLWGSGYSEKAGRIPPPARATTRGRRSVCRPNGERSAQVRPAQQPQPLSCARVVLSEQLRLACRVRREREKRRHDRESAELGRHRRPTSFGDVTIGGISRRWRQRPTVSRAPGPATGA